MAGSFNLFKDSGLVNITDPKFDSRRLRRLGTGGYDPGIQIGGEDLSGKRSVFADGLQIGDTTKTNFFHDQDQGFGSFDAPANLSTSTSQSQNSTVDNNNPNPVDFGAPAGATQSSATATTTPITTASIPADGGPGDPDGTGGDPPPADPTDPADWGLQGPLSDIEARLLAANNDLNMIKNTSATGTPLQSLLDAITAGQGQSSGFRETFTPGSGYSSFFSALNSAQQQIGDINQFSSGITDLGNSLQSSSDILAEIAGGSFSGAANLPGQGQLADALAQTDILGDRLGGLETLIPDLNKTGGIIPQIGQAEAGIGGLDAKLSPFMATLAGGQTDIDQLGTDAGDLRLDPTFLRNIQDVIPSDIDSAQRGLDTLGATAGGVGFDSNFLRNLQDVIPSDIGAAQRDIDTLGTSASDLRLDPTFLRNIQDVVPGDIASAQRNIDTLGSTTGDVGFDSTFLRNLQDVIPSDISSAQRGLNTLDATAGDLRLDPTFLRNIQDVVPGDIASAQRGIDTLGTTASGVGFDSNFLRNLQDVIPSDIGAAQRGINTLDTTANNLRLDPTFLRNIQDVVPGDIASAQRGINTLGADAGNVAFDPTFMRNLQDVVPSGVGDLARQVGDIGFGGTFLDDLTKTRGDVDALGNKIQDLGIDRLTADVVPFDDTGLTSLIEGMQSKLGTDIGQIVPGVGNELRPDITGLRPVIEGIGRQISDLNIPGLFGDVGETGVGGQVGDLRRFLGDEISKIGDVGPGGGTGGGTGGGGGGGDTAAILALLQAMQGPTGPEVSPGGIFGDVQTAIREMLQGPTTAAGLREDPLTASILADLQKQNSDREFADRERLQRAGVLRSGDNINLSNQRADDQSRAELAALGDAAERSRADRAGGVTSGTNLGQTLSNREIAIGELLGNLGGEQTLGGRQADLDVIGAIIAALDPAVDVGTGNKKQLGFASSLLDLLNLPPDQVEEIRKALKLDTI
jgi:hypothetical protein